MSRPPSPPPPPSRRDYSRPSRRERWLTNGVLVAAVVAIVATCVLAARLPPPRVCLEAQGQTVWISDRGVLAPKTRWTCLRWEVQP